jgi:hypothetical protein
VVSAFRRAIAEVKWSIIGWVTKNFKPLVPAAFTVVSTHQLALGPRGVFSLCVIHKEGLCPSIGDINWLMVKLT